MVFAKVVEDGVIIDNDFDNDGICDDDEVISDLIV